LKVARNFQEIDSMLRRSFPYLLFIASGLLGWWAWAKYRPSSPAFPEGRITRSASSSRQLAPPAPRLAFLTDLSKAYDFRIQLLRDALVTGCSEPEMQFLYQLLETGPAAAELPEHRYMVANDIMELLIKHEKDLSRCVNHFTALLNDPQQPYVIRDYAVQYLGIMIDPRSSSESSDAKGSSLSPEITAQVLKSLVTATTDPALGQTSIPGTALMTFTNLAGTRNRLDSATFATTLKPWLAQALGEGSMLKLGNRVSAVIAAGALAPQDFRPTLRKIAYQQDGEGALQLPALASLGQAGDATDVAQLQKITATQPALAYAAADASRVLTTRLSGEPSTSSH
jgi:hypothetical protein